MLFIFVFKKKNLNSYFNLRTNFHKKDATHCHSEFNIYIDNNSFPSSNGLIASSGKRERKSERKHFDGDHSEHSSGSRIFGTQPTKAIAFAHCHL